MQVLAEESVKYRWGQPELHELSGPKKDPLRQEVHSVRERQVAQLAGHFTEMAVRLSKYPTIGRQRRELVSIYLKSPLLQVRQMVLLMHV